MSDTAFQTQDELTALKARADLLGVPYHPSIGLDKLREKVNAVLVKPEDTADAPRVESEAAYRQRCMDEATKLVRIRLSCMNPNKSEWDGEILTVGNTIVGTHKKYIPFNAEEGWHVPHIMYEDLKARECQIFVTRTDSRGNKVREGKLIKEFAIEVLPPLTAEEIKDLAQRQAMAKSID